VAVHYGCHLLKPTKERGLGGFENLFFSMNSLKQPVQKVFSMTQRQALRAGGGVRSSMPEHHTNDRIQT